MENYNREEFIENYELTKDEYLVLSFDERMEYANQLFGYKVSELKNIGDTIVFGQTIDSRFYEYFENCGCRINDEDLGAEVTEVVKIGENNYESKAGVKDQLVKHIKLIGLIKAEIIEERKRNYYQVKKGRKSHKFAEKFNYVKEAERIKDCKISNLPAHEQRWLMKVEIENLIKSIDRGNQESFDLLVNDAYINYLERSGYQVTPDKEAKRYLLHK